MIEAGIVFLTRVLGQAIGDRVELLVLHIGVEHPTGLRPAFADDGRVLGPPPPVLRLTVLAAPRTSADALAAADAVLEFFHQRPVFDAATAPSLGPLGIARLTVAVQPLDLGTLAAVWQGLQRPALPALTWQVTLVPGTPTSVVRAGPDDR